MSGTTVRDSEFSRRGREPEGPTSPRSRAGARSLVRLLILAGAVATLLAVGVWATNTPTLLNAFFTWLLTSPGLSIQLTIMFLILYNLFGSSFGLSKLFLSQKATHRFWSAVFVVLLSSQVVMCTFYTTQSLRTWKPDKEDGPQLAIDANIYEQINECKFIYSSAYFRNMGNNPSKRIMVFFLVMAPPLLVLLLIPGLPIELFEGQVSERSAGGSPWWLSASGWPITPDRLVSAAGFRFMGWLLGLAFGSRQ